MCVCEFDRLFRVEFDRLSVLMSACCADLSVVRTATKFFARDLDARIPLFYFVKN